MGTRLTAYALEPRQIFLRYNDFLFERLSMEISRIEHRLAKVPSLLVLHAIEISQRDSSWSAIIFIRSPIQFCCFEFRDYTYVEVKNILKHLVIHIVPELSSLFTKKNSINGMIIFEIVSFFEIIYGIKKKRRRSEIAKQRYIKR